MIKPKQFSLSQEVTFLREKEMAVINISELHPAGSELFQDSESFLNELNNQEMGSILGNGLVGIITGQISISGGQVTISVGLSIALNNVQVIGFSG